MIATSLLQGAATVGVIATTLVALAAAVEKVFSPLGKWLQKWLGGPLDRRLHALQREVNRVGDRMELMSDRLDRLDRYARFHLGPNGTTTPVHTRIERLERAHNIEDDDD